MNYAMDDEQLTVFGIVLDKRLRLHEANLKDIQDPLAQQESEGLVTGIKPAGGLAQARQDDAQLGGSFAPD